MYLWPLYKNNMLLYIYSTSSLYWEHKTHIDPLCRPEQSWTCLWPLPSPSHVDSSRSSGGGCGRWRTGSWSRSCWRSCGLLLLFPARSRGHALLQETCRRLAKNRGCKERIGWVGSVQARKHKLFLRSPRKLVVGNAIDGEPKTCGKVIHYIHNPCETTLCILWPKQPCILANSRYLQLNT